jgi:hypothetical protein
MRFFWLLDYQHEVLGAFLGLGAALMIYLIFRSYYFTRERGDELRDEKFDYPDDIHGVNHRTPPHLIFVIFGFFVWAVFYVIIVGVYGRPF